MRNTLKTLLAVGCALAALPNITLAQVGPGPRPGPGPVPGGCQVGVACQAGSVAVGGATIGTDALAVTGTATLSSSLILNSAPSGASTGSGGLFLNGASTNSGTISAGTTFTTGYSGMNLFNSSGAIGASFSYGNSGVGLYPNTMFLGTRIAAAPLVFITAGTTARMWIDATGQTGIGSGQVFGWSSTAAPAGTNDTALSRDSAGVLDIGTGAAGSAAGSLKATNATFSGAAIILSGIASDAATTDASVCRKVSDGTLLIGSGTLGICLGTSSARYKHGITSLTPGLAQILALKPISYYLNAGHGDPSHQLYGFTAEGMQPVLPALVGLDRAGKPNTADYLGLIPVLVHAIQQQQAEIDTLRRQVAKLH